MARKPAQLVSLGLRQSLWTRIRVLALQSDTDFCLGDIVIGSESNDTARDYIVGLERAGYLAMTFAGYIGGHKQKPKRWRLAKDIGIEAPRVRKDGTPVTQGMAQEQMWRTLRMLKGDTNARELAAHASTTTIAVSPIAAGDYLRNLCVAEYLVCTQQGRGIGKTRANSKGGGNGIQARYRLKPASDTGPRAPMICRTNVLYDPNTQITVPLGRVTEEDAIYGK